MGTSVWRFINSGLAVLYLPFCDAKCIIYCLEAFSVHSSYLLMDCTRFLGRAHNMLKGGRGGWDQNRIKTGPRGSIASSGDPSLWTSLSFGDKLHFLVWALFSNTSCGGSPTGRRQATSSSRSSAGAALGREADGGGVQLTPLTTLQCVQPPLCFRWHKLFPIPLSHLLHWQLTSR